MPIPNRTLNDGNSLPAIGFGTYQLHGDDGTASVLSAIESGYRLIDTALNYENEAEVGQAIRSSGLDRSELIITSKLPGRFHGEGKTREGFMESLENLGLDYLDLFLIHWPLPRIDKYLQTWIELIQLKSEGLIRSVGVSNFTRSHLEKIISESGVVPAVNQIELHPHFPQAEMRKLHGELGIQTESWTPLARQRSVLQNPVIVAVSDAHNVTPAQAVLRWHIQLGTIPLPKSSQRDRQEENLNIFDFELSEIEMDQISGLESGRLWGGDPDTNEEF
ncbi:MAG: aldo/keto reductase [Homoserinimonas sp.]|nr:aldo/keto reductase [Homoserinimonas sp.]